MSAVTLYMYDDIIAALIPSGAGYVAYYVDGEFANLNAVKARFPNAVLVSIAVFPKDDAEALDVETGDATIPDIYDWLKRQLARGVERPVIYISAGRVDLMMQTMNANGFQRSEYRIWSAHYTGSPHLCGPNTCGVIKSTVADWTQYTSHALGRSLDESLLSDEPVFYRPKPAPAPVPAPKPEPKPVPAPAQPVLKMGEKGTAVVRLQTQLRDSGIPGVRGIGVDGVFGNQTETAVRNFQEAEFGPNGVDGIVGPVTWARLDKVSPLKAAETVAKPAAEPAAVADPEPVAAPEAPVLAPAEAAVAAAAPESVFTVAPKPPITEKSVAITMQQAIDALKILTEYVAEHK